MVGFEKNWHKFNDKISFEGSYAYVGEFFIPQFSKCAEAGIYKNIKDRVGIGFAPYLYHGINYKITKDVSFKSGLLLPNIFISSLEWKF